MKNNVILSWLIVFILLNLIAFKSEGQIKIQMINGKVFEAVNYSTGDMYINYKKPGTGRWLNKKVDRYDVFSILKADGTEEMIYQADSLDFSVEEARQYIKGEQAAQLYFHKSAKAIGAIEMWKDDSHRMIIKTRGATVGAIAIGIGSSVLSFYGLPVPMIYSVIVGRFNPNKIQVPDTFDKQISGTEPFRLGYQKTARNMKIQQSLKWGYVSLGVSIAAILLYENNK